MPSLWDYFTQRCQRLKRWTSRHRVGLLVTLAVSGATYYAYRKWKNFSLQLQQSLEEQQKSLAATRSRQYFERTQNACLESILSYLPTLRNEVFVQVPTLSADDLRNRSGKSQEEKLAAWESSKQSTFIRAYVALYTLCLFTVFHKVQLNIMGKHIIKNNSPVDGQPSATSLTDEVQGVYLSLYEHFEREGLTALTQDFRTEMEPVLAQWHVTRKCREEDLLALLAEIRTRLTSRVQNAKQYLLGNVEVPASASPVLKALTSETESLVSQEHFFAVFSACLQNAFGLFEQQLMVQARETNPQGDFSVAVLKLVPFLTKVINSILPEDPYNNRAYLHTVLATPALNDFADQIYGN